jgi:hypothetical protein
LSLPDYLRRCLMLSHKEEAVEVMVEAGFMAVEAFTVRVVSEVFMEGVFAAEAFMAEAASQGFIGAILGTFTAGGSLGFTAMAGFLAIIVFSFPVSMDIRGGGVGVTPIRIGVIRTTPITRTIRISRSRSSIRSNFPTAI